MILTDLSSVDVHLRPLQFRVTGFISTGVSRDLGLASSGALGPCSLFCIFTVGAFGVDSGAHVSGSDILQSKSILPNHLFMEDLIISDLEVNKQENSF